MPVLRRHRAHFLALLAATGALLIGGVAGPAAAGSKPTAPLLPPGSVAALDIPTARARVDEAVAAHTAALAEESSARALATELTAALEDVDGRIAELEPTHSREVNAYSSTRSRLVDAAVASYISGGRSTVQISAIVNSSDLSEYAMKMSFAGVVTAQLSGQADLHADLAASLSGSLRELGDARSDLAGRISNARAALDRASSRVAESAAVVTSERDQLTRLMVSAADAASASASGNSVAGIGPVAFDAYVRAAERVGVESPQCRLPWWAIAAIGRVESGHGTAYGAAVGPDGIVAPNILGPRLDGDRFAAIRDTDQGRLDGDTEWDRAVGPMQFIPSSWAAYVGPGVADPHNIYDAALATGRYLCRGARGVPLDTLAGLRAASFSYNHSTRYVDNVVVGAKRYAAEPVGPAGPRVVVGGLADGPAWDIVRAAALVDQALWRPSAAAVDGLVGNAAAIPQRSTVVVVTSPNEGVDVLGPALERAVSGLLGRRLVVVVTADDGVVAGALQQSLASWPNVSVTHAAGSSGAWSEAPEAGLGVLVSAVSAALTT